MKPAPVVFTVPNHQLLIIVTYNYTHSNLYTTKYIKLFMYCFTHSSPFPWPTLFLTLQSAGPTVGGRQRDEMEMRWTDVTSITQSPHPLISATSLMSIESQQPATNQWTMLPYYYNCLLRRTYSVTCGHLTWALIIKLYSLCII